MGKVAASFSGTGTGTFTFTFTGGATNQGHALAEDERLDQTRAVTARLMFETVGRVLVSVHTLQNPTDAEWNSFLSYIATNRDGADRVFVYSAGGGPDSRQRRALFATVGHKRTPTVLLTSSRVSLAMGVAVAWFNPHFKAFSPALLSDAFAFLRVSSHEGERVLEVVQRLAKALQISRAEEDLRSHRQPQRLEGSD